MAGKKGSLHSGWEDKVHVKECLEAYITYQGNCKKAARHLEMTHQYLRWIWIRAGLKPKGSRAREISQDILNECNYNSVRSVAKKYNIPISTLNKRYRK
jgi:Mor family transcriptional regulator